MRAVSSVRLGLTGGIGSGKSTVARMLKIRGATVIDADAIARACTQPGGSAMTAIAATFGADFVTEDGGLDRNRMRERVFQDPKTRILLEAIIHPLVGEEVALQAAAANTTCTVFDIPLLVESARWRPQLDRILVVDCTAETQMQRVMARNGWDRTTVEAILVSQSPRLKRLTAADLVLFNNTNDLKQLQQQVDRLAIRFGL